MLNVRLLGGLAADVDGRPVELPQASRARALLAWLALHPGTQPRARAAARLRPDVLDESARKSLRQAAWALRGCLGDAAGALVATREEIGLDPARVRVDLHELRRLAAEGALEEAAALARGELLAGIEEEWAHRAREEHGAEIDALFEALAARAEAAGDAAGAVAWTRRRCAADPLAETPARELVRRLAAAGDRAGALGVYGSLRDRLRRELGIVPSPETRALADAVRRGEPGASPGAAVPPPPPLPAPLAPAGPLVGRARELRDLLAAWADAAAGTPRVAALAGEPGIGKTRLTAELATRVRDRGGLVLYGRCDEDGIVPHQPLVEALERLLADLAPDARESLVAGRSAALARLLPGIPADEPAAAAPDAETARYRSFEAVRGLVEEVARRWPALLALDDLHWADPGTLALLRHLGRMLGRVRVLVLVTFRDTETGRGHPLAATLAELRRSHPVLELPLAGLDDDEVAALAGAPPGSERALALARRTRGNPLFVSELVRDLGEGSGGAPGLPPGVKDVIARRVDRLGRDAAETLAMAAIMGGEVDAAALGEALGDHEAALDALDRALEAGLVRDVEGAPGRFAFVHALVAEALVDGISTARRAGMHLRAAAALEDRVGGPGGPPAAEVARHLVAAGESADPAAVVRWSRRAGADAATRLADEEAASHLERALAALDRFPPDPALRAGVLAELGEARMRAGEVAGGRVALAEAAALAARAGDPALRARAALAAGGLGVTIGPADPALVLLLEEALAGTGRADRATRARLLGRLATELYYADRGRADVLSAEAVREADAAGDPGARAAALNARRVAIWDAEHARERLATATAMVEAGDEAGDRAWVLQGRNWRVLDLMELGRFREAEAEIAAYEAGAEELALPHYRWYVPLWRGTLAQVAGRWDDADRCCHEALALGRRAGDPNADLFVATLRVQLEVERGRLGAIDADWIRRGVAGSPAGWAWEAWLAAIEAARGGVDEARAIVARLAQRDFAAVALDANWHAAMDLAEALVALGDRRRAAALGRILTPYAGLHAVVARAAAWYGPASLALGSLALTAGDPAAAERHLAHAVAECERLGAGPRAEEARRRLARARAAVLSS